jgi:NH3-dependent NAD+ synthetase
MSTPALQPPRKINAAETFQRVVSWIKNRAVKDKMPGIIVGVSGTDSLVVFLAAYAAYKQLGKPEAVMAVNFVHPGALKKAADGGITCAAGDEKNWFALHIMPWLKQTAPDARYVLDDTIEFSDDNKRWGNIFSRAISDTELNHGMLGKYRLVAGTRNRTEAVLGTYTLLSRSPSLQPVEHLYKTQILDICASLNVPDIAIRKSREVDCDCGRFEVQANHMDALDHYIMAQQGDLDPAYLDTIDADVLAAVRNFYIEERENNAFREKIPYRPTPTKTVYAGNDIQTALQGVSGDAAALKSVSIVTPRILVDHDTAAAHGIVTSASPNRAGWLPEAFALMGTMGLSPAQTRDMATAVFGSKVAELDDAQVAALADITSRIGQIAFSFPAKRFTTQGFTGGASLIERAGFTRQTRSSDVRDASLPKSNPQRDELGTGFTWTDGAWHVEQRRAYVLFSDLSADMPVTLIIRNSSYYFGRDRLKNAAYVSFEKKSPNELLALTAADIDKPQNFMPWQNVPEAAEKLSRVAHALDAMDAIDCKFSQWLRTHKASVKFKSPFPPLDNLFNDGGGFAHLRALLKDILLQHIRDEKPASPLYLAQLDAGHAAPWQPHSTCPVTADTLAQLKAAQDGVTIKDDKLRKLFHPLGARQLVLISGKYGDFPAG